MAVETHIYDKQFFDNTLALEAASAAAVADSIMSHFQPRSVVDIGCGIGIYLREFAKRGVTIAGYDGAPAAVAHSLVGEAVTLHDLCEPLVLNKIFDMCLCFEVAEHLPPTAADTLVASIAPLADTLVFTAATPGQGPRSIGHINEQPHDYWIQKIEAAGMTFQSALTDTLRAEFAQHGVVWWIVKNLLIFQR